MIRFRLLLSLVILACGSVWGDEDLVLHLPFDEVENGMTNNKSGYDNHAVLKGSPKWGQNGKTR